MKKIFYVTSLAVLFTVSSCKSVLDEPPINSISADEFFNSESALKTYATGFLTRYLPGAAELTRGDQFSDIAVTTQSDTYLRPGYTAMVANNWTVSNWSQLYNINYFLKRLPEANGKVNADIIKHYEGVGRFWRAWFYWDKVKTFGGVPWYDNVIDPNDEAQLYKARDTREFVMAKVLEDLDFAIANCSDASKYVNTNVINKYIALALKSRITLFEGTFRKYHGLGNSDFWLRECVAASNQLMTNSPYGLVATVGNETKNYSTLFKSLRPEYREVMLANEMNLELSRMHDASWYYASGTAGQRNSANKTFVNMYLKLDGTRFTDQANFNKIQFKDEFADRDYRLRQSIITPQYNKTVAGTLTNDFSKVFPGLGAQLTYYRIIKWNMDDDAYESNTSSLNSLSVFRFGEVLLNYAEAKAELGEMNSSEWNKTIRPLRQRSGVNGQEPATADPYLVNYYTGVTDKWVLEVRRERSIEMFMENTRWNDLMRWKLGEKLTIEYAGLAIPEVGKSFDLNGDGINDICFYSSSIPRPTTIEPTVTYVQITAAPGDAATTFGLNSTGNLVYRSDRLWDDKMYLRPIPQVARNNNPNLEQNPDW